MIKISSKTFSGSGKVFDGTLAAALKSLAENQAVIAAAAVTDLVDSGGGTANGTIEAPVTVTSAALGSSDCAQKAALETAFGTVKDAVSEVVRQLNLVRAVVPAFAALTNSTGGTTPD